jgi:hypothetical protein
MPEAGRQEADTASKPPQPEAFRRPGALGAEYLLDSYRALRWLYADGYRKEENAGLGVVGTFAVCP